MRTAIVRGFVIASCFVGLIWLAPHTAVAQQPDRIDVPVELAKLMTGEGSPQSRELCLSDDITIVPFDSDADRRIQHYAVIKGPIHDADSVIVITENERSLIEKSCRAQTSLSNSPDTQGDSLS